MDIINCCLFDITGLGLDNGNSLVELGEDGVANLVDFGDVGFCVRGWLLQVGEKGLDESAIGKVGNVDRLLAVWVGFEGRDRVADDGVFGNVLIDISSAP